MNDNMRKNILLARTLAWIGLVTIIIFLLIIVYGLITRNGKLALAFIVGLIFFSIIIWIGIKIYKNAEKYSDRKKIE